MKKNVLKSLVLGVGFSLLFSVGSFACEASTRDSILEQDIKSLKESGKYRVVANLGEEFGECSGYYKLNLANSFEGVNEIEEGEALYKLPDNQIVFSFREGESGGDAFFTTEDVSLTPDKVYKNNEGEMVVSLENGNKLYWEKLHESDQGVVLVNSNRSIENFIEKGTDTKYEVVAKLGEEFGEFSGYYKLDLANSFEGVNEITEGEAVYGLGDNEVIVSFEEKSGGGITYLTTGCISLTPDKVYKNSEGKMISLEKEKVLYWDKMQEENGQLVIDRTK